MIALVAEVDQYRKALGDTVEEMCRKIGLSPSAFHKMKAGSTSKPHRMTVEAMKRYVRAAKRKVSENAS